MNDEERDMGAESDEDRRARHNAMERRRRDHIKYSFISLRDALPDMQGVKASRVQILRKAADYIQTMRKKNAAHRVDIEELKEQNRCLAAQMKTKARAVKKSKKNNGGDSCGGSSASIGDFGTPSNSDTSGVSGPSSCQRSAPR
nr:protein max-like [Dermacentor andersoni]